MVGCAGVEVSAQQSVRYFNFGMRAHFPSPLVGEGGEPGEGSVPRLNSDPSPALARLRLRSGTLSHKGRGEAPVPHFTKHIASHTGCGSCTARESAGAAARSVRP